MIVSQKGINFLKKQEGLVLHAYLDSVGVPTIGYGNTQYEDGTKVKIGEKITEKRAEILFSYWLSDFSRKVSRLIKSELNQNQFDALVSLSYNIGIGAFSRSTILKKVNANPSDPSIEHEFMRWNKAGGKPILTKRRRQEWLLYSLIS
jgi:lysozyme